MATKLSEKLTIPATAKCPLCGEEAKWYNNRYVCRAQVLDETSGRISSRHDWHGFHFTNNVGVCESYNSSASGVTFTAYCDRVGTPEPATKVDYSYSEDKLVEVPNTDWHNNSLEGKFYCGTHSPSKKALKQETKRMEETRRHREIRESKEARVKRETDEVEAAGALLLKLANTSEEVKAVDLLLKKVLDQITRAAYDSRY